MMTLSRFAEVLLVVGVSCLVMATVASGADQAGVAPADIESDPNRAPPCDPAVCVLPDCFCPGDLPAKDVPMKGRKVVPDPTSTTPAVIDDKNTTTVAPDNSTTTTVTPTPVPDNSTTTTKPTTTTTTVKPTPVPDNNTTTTTSTTPAPSPTPVPDNSTTTTTTVAPSPSPSPITTTTPAPAPGPVPHCKRFDGYSFVGGMILAYGSLAIALVLWKFYKARTERNYHTL